MVTEDCVLRTWFLSVPEISSSILATAQQALMPPDDHLGGMGKWIILGIHQARWAHAGKHPRKEPLPLAMRVNIVRHGLKTQDHHGTFNSMKRDLEAHLVNMYPPTHPPRTRSTHEKKRLPRAYLIR